MLRVSVWAKSHIDDFVLNCTSSHRFVYFSESELLDKQKKGTFQGVDRTFQPIKNIL